MQVPKPAILKPGVTFDSLPGPRESDIAIVGAAAAPLIHGKALIIWDPKNPSKKLDAIDTDQITPAADCVSESLATLDERWKAGSFRYLMPDFRARVHRGDTFVIAGDRFAIGSSREMSPVTGSPPPNCLPMVTMSGAVPVCSEPQYFPVRPKPVIISSTISSASNFFAIAFTAGRNSFGGGWFPPAPSIGSTRKAAIAPELAERT